MNKLFEVFFTFLKLGLISFGGPAAHIGYFQKTFVEQHQWLDVNAYGRLVALSQFLPGPGSSQVGFGIGMERAGILGGVMAFVGFTLPSFLLMWLLAVLGTQFAETVTFVGIVKGLKLLAVVVVADAIVTMSKSFCQTVQHRVIAIVATLALLFWTSLYIQIGVLILAAVIGALLPNMSLKGASESVSKPDIRWPALFIFTLFFVGLPFVASSNLWLNMINDFYQAGSLVFGGGHVVLPLLEQTVGQQMTADQFVTGYAAAQAVPGPMFTLASFLGAQVITEHSFWASLVATLAIFIPGFLLVIAFQKSWHQLSTQHHVAGAMSAVNAVVVGILAAALYQPIAVSALHSIIDVIIVTVGFVLLRFLKLPIVMLVGAFAAIGVILTL